MIASLLTTQNHVCENTLLNDAEFLALLDEMEKMARPVDFHGAVSVPLPLKVICDLFGISYANHADILRWAEDAA